MLDRTKPWERDVPTSNVGYTMQPICKLVWDKEQSCQMIKQVDEVDIDAEIQSAVPPSIYDLLAQMSPEYLEKTLNTSSLSLPDSSFGDISEMPSDYFQAVELVNRTNKSFSSLPEDFRSQFAGVGDMMSAINDGTFNDKLAAYLSSKEVKTDAE